MIFFSPSEVTKQMLTYEPYGCGRWSGARGHHFCSAMNVFVDVNNISQRVHVNIQRWTFPMQYCNELASSWWQALTIVNSSMNFLPSEVTSQYKAVFEIIQRWFLFRIPSEVTTTWQYGIYAKHIHSAVNTSAQAKWQLRNGRLCIRKLIFWKVSSKITFILHTR